MSDEPQEVRNPFQEVALYLSRSGNDFRMAELIKRFGFTVYAFVSLQRLTRHLKENPMTAAVFLQDKTPERETQVRKDYHGPIYDIVGEGETLLESLGNSLREIHRNQLKVLEPKVTRVLKTLDSFVNGSQKTVFLLGSEAAITMAMEYVRVFKQGPLVEINGELPSEIPDATDNWFITHGLFTQPLAWQQKWSFLFGESGCPHLIADPLTVDALDRRYVKGELDEMLYERLSFRQLEVDTLEGHTVEELLVQPLQKTEARLILDSVEDSARQEADAPSKAKKPKSFLDRLLGR